MGSRAAISAKAVHLNLQAFPHYGSLTDTLDDNLSILKLLSLYSLFFWTFHYVMKAEFLEVNLSDFSSFSPLIIAENGSVGGIVFVSLADFHQMRVLKKSLIVQNEHSISTNLWLYPTVTHI